MLGDSKMHAVRQEVHLPASILENSKKEPLTPLISPYRGIKATPAELCAGDEATLVFVGLLDCFKKSNMVAEGLLPNVVWGFEQCGFDPRSVAMGLTKLRKLGYIRYTDDLGGEIFEQNFDPQKPIFIRYTKKFIDLLVKEGAPSSECAKLSSDDRPTS
jgi:hypothetical protein